MKNNNIPEFILCSTPELARQVLEKIEPFIGQMPTNYCKASFGSYYTAYDLLSDMYPMIINTNEGDYLSFVEQDSCPITNFTKAEDFLNNNYMTEKTWENLEVGDILIDNNNDEYKVLGICGEVIFYSIANIFDLLGTGNYLTKRRLIELGYKIKGASEDKPKEIKEAILLLESIPVDYYGSSDRTDICKVIEMLKKLK